MSSTTGHGQDDVAPTTSADAGPSLTTRVMENASASAPAGQTRKEHELPEVAQGDEERAVDEGLNDLGWSEDPKTPTPMMRGLKNEDVWQLVRRFNKQIYHLKTIEGPPQGGIDLNIADQDAFTPDKLRSTLERVYMTIGLGLAAFVKHIARLRSWKEWKRTSLFFLGFLAVWLFNLVMPALFGLITVLLASTYLRHVLFPPAPLAAISASTGEAKVPKAGQLGSDGLTGAAESYKGEAVEQEASNAVGSVAHMAVSTAIGNDSSKVQNSRQAAEESDEGEDEEASKAEDQGASSSTDGAEGQVPDPASITLASKDAQSKVKGEKQHAENQSDPSAAPMQKSVWQGAQPLLHGLEDAADTWERFANALSPTAPFAQHAPRLSIAGIVAPLMLVSLFVTVDVVYRSTTLLLGLLFFGQPVLDRMKVSDFKKLLDEKIPDWPRYLELRNSILKGVPTNAQLTLTLLRIGEANKSPLPPPPPAAHAPPPTAKQGKEMVEDVPEEYKEDMDVHQKDVVEERSVQPAEKPKKQSKFMSLLKGSTRAGTNAMLGANFVKAEAGFEHAKRKVGVVRTQPALEAMGDGPASFHARHKGKRGLVLVSTTATTPCVSFEKVWPAHAKAAQSAYLKAKEMHEKNNKPEEGQEEPDALATMRDMAEKARPTPAFSVQIDDIVSLKKLGGLGWKGKLVVGWALEGEIADGIEIETKDGHRYAVTALPRRDELFNRLAALGREHQWEAW